MQENDSLAQQLRHQQGLEWKTEMAQLRQRLEWLKILLANEKQQLSISAEEPAVLRRTLTEWQRVKRGLEIELGLAQKTVQSFKAKRRCWATKAKKVERLAAAKQEAGRCRRVLRLQSAEAQELREVRGRLTEAEKANLLLTSSNQRRKKGEKPATAKYCSLGG